MYKEILSIGWFRIWPIGLSPSWEIGKTFDAEIILVQAFLLCPSMVAGAGDALSSWWKAEGSGEKYLANLTEELKKKGLKVSAMVRTGQQVAVEIIDLWQKKVV